MFEEFNICVKYDYDMQMWKATVKELPDLEEFSPALDTIIELVEDSITITQDYLYRINEEKKHA